MSAIGLLREASEDRGSAADLTANEPESGTDADKAAYPIYRELAQVSVTAESRERAKTYLQNQLANVTHLPCDMPHDSAKLMAWVESGALQVGEAYSDYLNKRKQGRPRRYFQNRSAALTYLRLIAPTKLVDGAWLYGILPYWQDARFKPLVTTYLEELGEGDAAFNHVHLYKNLLGSCDCETDILSSDLSDDYFRQGAIQLALAYHGEEFLPEIIGYNLGYEQPPLHLLITAYELKELGIDPYYFTLHVTTDNASVGHAQKAVDVVRRALPSVNGDLNKASHMNDETFLNRVRLGYQLNELGPSAETMIDDFNLQEQVIAMLQRKSAFGKNMHSDYCRIGGRTVNEWLEQPENIEGFLKALEKYGWIKRHEDPEKSRFWNLIEGDKPAMFGVFSAYEAQLLYDWIAGDWLEMKSSRRPRVDSADHSHNKDVVEEKQFRASLQSLPTSEKARQLIELMSPAMHHKPKGLLATRLFKGLYEKA